MSRFVDIVLGASYFIALPFSLYLCGQMWFCIFRQIRKTRRVGALQVFILLQHFGLTLLNLVMLIEQVGLRMHLGIRVLTSLLLIISVVGTSYLFRKRILFSEIRAPLLFRGGR